jgi:hypothetical protein
MKESTKFELPHNETKVGDDSNMKNKNLPSILSYLFFIVSAIIIIPVTIQEYVICSASNWQGACGISILIVNLPFSLIFDLLSYSYTITDNLIILVLLSLIFWFFVGKVFGIFIKKVSSSVR